jgi:hypothetical protein
MSGILLLNPSQLPATVSNPEMGTIFEAGWDCNNPQPKKIAASHPRVKSLHAFVTFFITVSIPFRSLTCPGKYGPV